VLGTRHSDAECGQCEEEECERHEPPPVAPADHAGQHFEIREADRITHPAALGQHVERNRERHDEERQEEQGTFERHEPPPHTAPTWTTARIPCIAAVARTFTRTRRPCTVRVALTL